MRSISGHCHYHTQSAPPALVRAGNSLQNSIGGLAHAGCHVSGCCPLLSLKELLQASLIISLGHQHRLPSHASCGAWLLSVTQGGRGRQNVKQAARFLQPARRTAGIASAAGQCQTRFYITQTQGLLLHECSLFISKAGPCSMISAGIDVGQDAGLCSIL